MCECEGVCMCVGGAYACACVCVCMCVCMCMYVGVCGCVCVHYRGWRQEEECIYSIKYLLGQTGPSGEQKSKDQKHQKCLNTKLALHRG